MVRMQQVLVQPPAWRLRAAVSVLLIISLFLARSAYQAVQGPLEASIAVRQLEDGAEGYVVGSAVATSDVPFVLNMLAAILLLAIWVPFIVKGIRYLQLEKVPEQS